MLDVALEATTQRLAILFSAEEAAKALPVVIADINTFDIKVAQMTQESADRIQTIADNTPDYTPTGLDAIWQTFSTFWHDTVWYYGNIVYQHFVDNPSY